MSFQDCFHNQEFNLLFKVQYLKSKFRVLGKAGINLEIICFQAFSRINTKVLFFSCTLVGITVNYGIRERKEL
jgi:hypothetical protein